MYLIPSTNTEQTATSVASTTFRLPSAAGRNTSWIRCIGRPSCKQHVASPSSAQPVECVLGCLDVRAAREEDQQVARRLRRVDAAHRVDGRAEVVCHRLRETGVGTEPEFFAVHAGAGEEAVYNALAEGAVVVQADDDPKVQAARRRGLDAAEHDTCDRHPVVRVVHHDSTVAGEERVGGELAEERAVRDVLDDRVGVRGAVVEGDGVPHLASELGAHVGRGASRREHGGEAVHLGADDAAVAGGVEQARDLAALAGAGAGVDEHHQVQRHVFRHHRLVLLVAELPPPIAHPSRRRRGWRCRRPLSG
uniref:Uncharacterized protein n=1 Tax=Oryza rufipogon TaxID=4529 RepID=A0A0E0R595_ORYRU